jgi:hypothetical protein
MTPIAIVLLLMVASAALFGPLAVLAVFYLLTMAFTQPMSNQAAALLVLPIALETAQAASVEPRAVAVTVALAASSFFLTPLEPSCLLVYGPGRYRFLDYPRLGIGLTLIALALTPLAGAAVLAARRIPVIPQAPARCLSRSNRRSPGEVRSGGWQDPSTPPDLAIRRTTTCCRRSAGCRTSKTSSARSSISSSTRRARPARPPSSALSPGRSPLAAATPPSTPAARPARSPVATSRAGSVPS